MKIAQRFIITFVCILSSITLSAQTQYGETFKSRLFVGGTFSLQFGTYTNFDVSPMAGYNFNRYFSAGLGATYMFYSYRDPYQSYRSSFYGGRVFGRIVPLPDLLPGLFVHAEYEEINNDRGLTGRIWTPAFLTGIGFRQQAGQNSYFTLSLLYNISDDGTYGSSIYGGPIIPRIGFIYGFY